MVLPRRLPVPTLALAGALALAACQVLAGLDGALDPPPLTGLTSDGGTAERPDSGAPNVADAEVDAPDASTASAYADAVLADGPIAYLRFDEPSGASCADATGNGNGANLTGPFERGRPGVVAGPGAGVRLGGSAQMPLDAAFDLADKSDFTVELWVRPEAAASRGDVLVNLESTGGSLYGAAIYFDTSTPFVGYEQWSKTLLRYAHAETPVSLAPNGALHVVVVLAGGRPTLFVNGTRYSGVRNADPDGAAPKALVFGRWRGDYDELALYAKALSEVRIAAHYARGIGD